MSTIDDYYRRDRESGVTAPDLSKLCTYAEHIVRARGKRTKYTSLSLDPDKIDDFGPALYRALRAKIGAGGHTLIEHRELMQNLSEAVLHADKLERRRALQAQRYAIRRREGLVDWSFDVAGVERKELITWTFGQVQRFFRKVR